MPLRSLSFKSLRVEGGAYLGILSMAKNTLLIKGIYLKRLGGLQVVLYQS